MLETIFLSLAAFVGTNVDDLFIGMLFYSDAKTASDSAQITIGKFLGMGMLTAFSLLGALGLQLFQMQRLSLLGVVPLGLGVLEIIRSIRGSTNDSPPAKAKALWLSLMLITLANGADNIGIYIPLFSGFVPWQMAAAVCVFALMTGLSCMLGRRLSSLAFLRSLLQKYRHVIIPSVYIQLGICILF